MVRDFKDYFSARTADYAAFRPTYPETLLEWLAAATPRHDVALDCGCGTGQLSTRLARYFRRVVATDASAEQLRDAKRHEHVEYRQARAEATGLPDASVDIVTVAQAAHWLDLPEFYDEVRRVVRPGGLISLITYDTVEASHPVRPLLAQFYSEVIGPYWPAERKHVETGYRLLAFPFDEIATPAMTMRSSWTFKELIGYIDTWSAIRNCEAIRGRQPIELFFTELEQLWGDMDIRREFSWKLSMRVGRV